MPLRLWQRRTAHTTHQYRTLGVRSLGHRARYSAEQQCQDRFRHLDSRAVFERVLTLCYMFSALPASSAVDCW